ncbi:protein bicaudal C homolog 1-like isoform X2 [Scleropages formosus]|uniref:protein bicaudal C homolog 1-like isoform X2 n=1 Tax=Scleropages formosus TaxID=113540 RepID=UPI0010FA7C2F|nr:protein bicaudal C homolog 1-like isoform X2 [Scleropages formosus]
MAAQREPSGGPSVHSVHSDPGSNSERSGDSPAPGSENDSCGPSSPLDPEWTEERFRVDRKKLEIMLIAATEGKVNGEGFFQKVMEETNTQVAWPSKLKIGAKSKKDPHIKVSGKRDNVLEAKEKIMSVLDTKSNRVTLKMDVSHTEHSHVIGKGGNNIKKVMEDTDCHIHFPDSNRSNQAEKSNQVSIAGQPAGVEAARTKIRELIPLVLMFELPAIVQPDPNSLAVQHISQSYNISVSFKQHSRLYGITAVVKGSQSNLAAVKRGTALLLEHLAGSLANTISVTTHMDIAPQHHLFIMGRSSSNVKHIMQRTGAQIHFPDPSSPQKRSSVYLQGTIDSVCLARQYIMGCLPLVLMFDIKEHVEVEQLCITTLMEQLDVFIRIKPKPKQPSKSVIVKSVERNAFRMYEARRFLLGLESSGVSAPSSSSPSTVLCPIRLEILGSSGLGLTSMVPSASNTSTPSPLLNTINSSASLLQPTGLSGPSQLWSSSLASPTSSPGFPLGLMMHPATHATLTSILLSGVQGYTQSTPSPPPGLAPLDTHVNRIPDCGTTVCALNGHMKHPISVYSRMSTVPLEDKVLISSHNDPEASTHSPSESISSKSSANESSNDTFVEVGMPRSPSHSANSSELKQMLASCKAPASTGKQQAVELLQCTKNSRFHSEWLLSDPESSASKSMLTDKRAPGSEWAAERAAQQNSKRAHLAPQTAFTNMRAFDYEQKKLLATKAMLKKPVVTEVRTPTSTWSGLGFSKSMPAETIKELRRANHVAYKPTMIMTYEDSPLSRSSSREGLGSGSDSTNWRERNGSGIAMHPEFPSSVSSPKRKQNKSELYLSSSNYMDCISSMAGSNGCTLSMSLKGSDLPELFSKLGLGKYIDVFQQQEIDLQTFLTLTDQDLKELGITTFGARRKMLLAISELNKNRRKMFEPPSIRSSFLEGGSSGRLPRQFHSDMASVSGQW